MNTTLLDGLWQEGRDFLGVRYPILCGAMTWISDATLVTAVSKQGGFASLAAGNMPGEPWETVGRNVAKSGGGKPRSRHRPANHFASTAVATIGAITHVVAPSPHFSAAWAIASS